ncbi:MULTISPECIES: hypothetical protein [unclassified Nostoc]|uniref:hypothetical protein n=1 Tax=unclassified Nostoc TaxID=2593658 RepID=UPI002AD2463B|nr:hypothetical protein [Nostoc sp. DedQUE03]MDZ7974410.1 hypothetical protein [Nostoc sp. DedQUE03]MDZ8047711.1 hypothetical protein [Nostoc sp. DedQUE02]
MVHPVYKARIEADIKRLISTSNEIENIKHKGLRGAFRESSLDKSKLRIAGFDRSLLTDALNCLNKAIELNPLYEQALVLKGTIYNMLSQFAEARDTYVKAMGINSANEEILKKLIIQEYNLSLHGEQNTLISHEELSNWMQGNYEDK